MFTQKPGTFLWGISLYTKKKGAANCRPLRLLKDYHIMLLISRVFYKWSSSPNIPHMDFLHSTGLHRHSKDCKADWQYTASGRDFRFLPPGCHRYTGAADTSFHHFQTGSPDSGIHCYSVPVPMRVWRAPGPIPDCQALHVRVHCSNTTGHSGCPLPYYQEPSGLPYNSRFLSSCLLPAGNYPLHSRYCFRCSLPVRSRRIHRNRQRNLQNLPNSHGFHIRPAVRFHSFRNRNHNCSGIHHNRNCRLRRCVPS